MITDYWKCIRNRLYWPIDVCLIWVSTSSADGLAHRWPISPLHPMHCNTTTKAELILGMGSTDECNVVSQWLSPYQEWSLHRSLNKRHSYPVTGTWSILWLLWRNMNTHKCPLYLLASIYQHHNDANQEKFIDTLRPIPNGCHFADDISKSIFIYENCSSSVWISISRNLF